MDLVTRMVEHHVWLTGEMVDRAARLDDAVLDKPIEISVEGVDDDPTLRSLLSRLVGQMGMWNAAMASREYDWSVEKHEPIDSMRRRLAVEGPAYLGLVREVVGAGTPRRHVRRRLVRAGRGLHLRRDDRPRADVRGASPDARRGRPDRRRDHRSRRGRSAAVGRERPLHDAHRPREGEAARGDLVAAGRRAEVPGRGQAPPTPMGRGASRRRGRRRPTAERSLRAGRRGRGRPVGRPRARARPAEPDPRRVGDVRLRRRIRRRRRRRSARRRSAARGRRSSRGSATRRRASPRRRAGCSTRSGSRTRASTPSSRSTPRRGRRGRRR